MKLAVYILIDLGEKSPNQIEKSINFKINKNESK